MIPLDVYRTSRKWWRRPWQAELTVADPPDAVAAFTRWGALRRGCRSWSNYAARGEQP